MKHSAIATTAPMVGYRRVQDRLYLFHCKVADQSRVGFLGRDPQDAANLFQSSRYSEFKESEKGLDGGESDIASAGSVTVSDLDIP